MVGAVAFCGYDAVSKASSIAISPPSATIGVTYVGTITYSGGHAGAVQSMSINGHCLGSYALAPGLTATYNGINTASVSGTPTGSIGTVAITATVSDGSGCSGGLSDTRSTSLIIQNSGGGPVAPSMLVSPQSTLAQVGSDVILSGGASGNPAPAYFWKQGITVIPGATNNTLLIPSAQMTNAGVYSLVASNSQGQANSACDLTMAITPGSNTLGLFFTNYVAAGQALTMDSLITNVPAGVNTYSWQFNNNSIGVTSSNLSLSAAQVVPSKSGIYSVTFNSTVAGNTVVNNQQYISYWAFGYPPTLAQQPTNLTLMPGSNATFAFTVAGGNYPAIFLYENQTNLVAQTNLPSYNPSTGTATTNISFTISNVVPADAGSYTVVVTNFWGSTGSSNIALSVGSSLSVSAPQGQTNYAGKNISLSVTPSGTLPFGFQWQKEGLNLADGGNVSGALTNVLNLAPAATNDSGNYQVVVTNISGSVTSSVAFVSILPVPRFALTIGAGALILDASGGIPGSNYVVQVSTNLANSGGWMPVATDTVPANGSIALTNVTPLNGGDLYYRIQFP